MQALARVNRAGSVEQRQVMLVCRLRHFCQLPQLLKILQRAKIALL